MSDTGSNREWGGATYLSQVLPVQCVDSSPRDSLEIFLDTGKPIANSNERFRDLLEAAVKLGDNLWAGESLDVAVKGGVFGLGHV